MSVDENVEVIQADREAAADYWLGEGYGMLDEPFRKGDMDQKAMVQAFARHRPADPPAGYRFDAFADVRMGKSLFEMRNEDWLLKEPTP